jgi:hypothetical protein
MKFKLLLAAATLAACTTVLNAADEKAQLGRIMWSAFQCSAYAELSENKNEQERLFLVGLNAGRAFLEAMKAGQISEQATRDEVPINCSGLKVQATTSSSAKFTQPPQATHMLK